MTSPPSPAEPSGFNGFGAGAIPFFEQLEQNNERAWFKQHRAEYEAEIAGPLRALSEALEAEFGPVKVHRPFRDVRFSPDKRPIQEHASLAAIDLHGLGYYTQVSANGVFVAGGLYQPDRERLERFRALLDVPRSVTEIKRQLAEAEGHGFQLSEERMLKTAPRGFSRDHPEIELLRHTQLALGKHYPPAGWLTEASYYDRIREDWGHLRVWNTWLADAGV